MRAHYWIVIFAFTLFSCCSFAADLPKNFPSALLYQGQPIDPLCFDPMETANSKVSLKTCGIQSEPSERKNGQDKDMLTKGFVGFDYVWMDDKGNSQSRGYSYYKAFANPDQSYTIYTISSGGGSGQFSSLILVKRMKDTLELKSLAGGDRCNNGIYDVKEKGKVLTYNVNMTPFDFLDLSKQNPHKLEAYTDLAACASCCVGSATIERDLQTHKILLEKVMSINIDRDISEIVQTNQGKRQICFNELLLNHVKSGKTNLKPQELIMLMDKFNKQCV